MAPPKLGARADNIVVISRSQFVDGPFKVGFVYYLSPKLTTRHVFYGKTQTAREWILEIKMANAPTIKTTLRSMLMGALLGAGVLLASVISTTSPTLAHETNTISSLENCRIVQSKTGVSKRVCQSNSRVKVSAVTIYNRRHCHANGVCHKHRFINPNHRH